MRLRPQLLLFLLPLRAWAAAAAVSEPEPGDPNQHAATSPSDHLCEAGHYLAEDCYMGQARMCCPCPPGTFLSHPNKEVSCRPCTPCRKDQEMVRDCTPTGDRQCQCKPGEFYCDSGHCPESCHRCTSCPGATLQACTATRDTVCDPEAPAQPGPSAFPLAVSALVVSGVTLVIVVAAIACWWRGGVPLSPWACRFAKSASVEPGSHGHILKTTGPESGPPASNAETTQLLKEACTLKPGAQTRPGPSADPDADTDTGLDSDPDPDTDTDLDFDLDPDTDTDPDPDPDTNTDPDPDPDPGAGVELQVQVEVEVEGGGREAPELATPSPAAAAPAAPGALAWAEAAAGLRPPGQEHKCLFGEGHVLMPPNRLPGELGPQAQDGTRA